MTDSAKPAVADIQAVLTPAAVRQLQVIQTALTLSVLLFLAALVAFWAFSAPADHSGSELLPLLSIVHAFIAFSTYSVSTLLYNMQFAPDRLRSLLVFPDSSGSTNGRETAEGFLGLFRSALIIRLALFESAACFGLVVCGIAVASGVITTQPEYWFNTTTTLVLLVFSLLTFPTRERLQWIFEEKLGQRVPS